MEKKDKKTKKHQKKKGGKKSLDTLQVLDAKMDHIHDNLIMELEEMEKHIRKRDKKIKKKARKLSADNGLLSVFNPTTEMQKVRFEVANQMERVNIFAVLEDILKGCMPIIVVISRLVASLILLIFQCPFIRNKIPMKTLANMDRVYRLARGIG